MFAKTAPEKPNKFFKLLKVELVKVFHKQILRQTLLSDS